MTPAVKKWNLDYLQANFGSGDYSVYLSKDHRFKYFDEKKSSELKQFRNPMKRVEMKFPDFVTRIRAAKPDDTPRLVQCNLSVFKNCFCSLLWKKKLRPRTPR